jgi:hypothetical protein
MSEEIKQLERRLDAQERELRELKRRFRGLRMQSLGRLFGLPLLDIAIGPDAEMNEIRGHARGLFAIGDIATGVVAVGGVARGIIALGGVAIGVVAIGGLSIGFGLACAGLAIGLLAGGGVAAGIVAVGSVAAGVVACGEEAFGYYAQGHFAAGAHVVSAITKDPQAVQFFNQWPILKWFGGP